MTPALTPLHLFLLACLGGAAVLIALAALAPSVLYRWTPRRGRILGRWRVEMAVTGGAIFVGTALSLLLVTWGGLVS